MIPPFNFWCQKVMPLVYDNSLSYFEVLCKVVVKLNECINQTNTLSEALKQFQNWVYSECVTPTQMLNEYKLDRNGDFTGTIYGSPAYLVQSNRDTINYLVSQFQDGQTGLAIDGGFFQDSGIRKNYNGGYF